MNYVYVLDNNASEWCIGCTNNLKPRLFEHNNGKSTYTSHRGPYELIYYEACSNKKDAFAREKYLKSGMGRRYLKTRLKQYLKGAME